MPLVAKKGTKKPIAQKRARSDAAMVSVASQSTPSALSGLPFLWLAGCTNVAMQKENQPRDTIGIHWMYIVMPMDRYPLLQCWCTPHEQGTHRVWPSLYASAELAR